MAISIETSNSRQGAHRPIWPALIKGWRCRCPNCGSGRMFGAYLKVNPACPACQEELHHHRADDAPPYFTMLIVGHIIVGGLLAMERALKPETWVQLAIWLPATLILSLILLPRVKGALIAAQWAMRMHGFATAGLTPIETEFNASPQPKHAEHPHV